MNGLTGTEHIDRHERTATAFSVKMPSHLTGSLTGSPTGSAVSSPFSLRPCFVTICTWKSFALKDTKSDISFRLWKHLNYAIF